MNILNILHFHFEASKQMEIKSRKRSLAKKETGGHIKEEQCSKVWRKINIFKDSKRD